jgi:hypothetical protein
MMKQSIWMTACSAPDEPRQFVERCKASCRGGGIARAGAAPGRVREWPLQDTSHQSPINPQVDKVPISHIMSTRKLVIRMGCEYVDL